MGLGLGDKLSCGGKCMKWFLITFNFIVLLVGSAILGVAVWIKVDPDVGKYLKIINLDASVPYIEYSLYVCMGVGGVLILIGFLGCCGAGSESACLLCLYATLLIVIIIGMLGGAVLAILFRAELEGYLKTSMARQANTMVLADTKDPLTFAWNTMQYNLGCCGGNSYKDYEGSTFQNQSTRAVPETCCKTDNEFFILDPELKQCNDDVVAANEDAKSFYSTGCFDKAKEWIFSKAYILIGVASGVIVFLILTVVSACCVRKDLKNHD